MARGKRTTTEAAEQAPEIDTEASGPDAAATGDGDGFDAIATAIEDDDATQQDSEPDAPPAGQVIDLLKRKAEGGTWAALDPGVTVERDEEPEVEAEEPTQRPKPRPVDRPAIPATGRQLLSTQTITIPVDLDEHEVNERGRKLAATTNREDELKAEKSAFLSTWNGQMKELQEERRKLSEAVRSGREERDYDVTVWADYDAGRAEYITADGRVVQQRPLTADEVAQGRQQRLPLAE